MDIQMNIKAIVYTSETGTSAEYARMLGEKSGLPVFSLDKAKAQLAAGCEIIYIGWLMAGGVKDYKKAAKSFSVKVLCAVGLCETGSITNEVRKNNAVPADTAVFTLQGGYSPEKLRGIYRFMMKLVTKVLIKKIDGMHEKKESDLRMREVLISGGSFVDEGHLEAVLAYLRNIAP